MIERLQSVIHGKYKFVALYESILLFDSKFD